MSETENKSKELEVFDPATDEFEIRRIAKGVSLEEAAQCFGYELNELPEADHRFLKAQWSRGRAEAKVEAVENLFTHMKSGKDAGQLSIRYLSTFGEEWPSDGVSATKDGLAFKVVLDGNS